MQCLWHLSTFISPVNDIPITVSDTIRVMNQQLWQNWFRIINVTFKWQWYRRRWFKCNNSNQPCMVHWLLFKRYIWVCAWLFETVSDSFTYKSNDGTADGNTVTVTIPIIPVNDPPIGVEDLHWELWWNSK